MFQKVQIPSTKFQINLKIQYSMTKTAVKNERPTSNFELPTLNYGRPSTFIFFLFVISNFGHWNLSFDFAQDGEPVEPFDIWDLIFEISISQ